MRDNNILTFVGLTPLDILCRKIETFPAMSVATWFVETYIANIYSGDWTVKASLQV